MIEHMQLDLIEEDENTGIINDSPLQEVTETTLDLDTYINNYKDFGKYLRLIFIARRCRPLRLEALVIALDWLKQSWNFVEYCKVFNIIGTVVRDTIEMADATLTSLIPGVCCRDDFNFQRFQTRVSYDTIRLPDGRILEFDSEWVDKTRRQSNQTIDQLDTDLKNYKANNMAESIRRGCDELASVHMKTGDLLSANKNYTRSRDYCKTDMHELMMCFNVIKVSIYLSHWRHVSSYVDRADTLLENITNGCTVTQNRSTNDDTTTSTWKQTSTMEKVSADQKDVRQKMKAHLHCVVGLVEMYDRNFAAAARAFLQVDHDYVSFNSILTANDVALYGTVCSLATFDRNALKSMVIQNSNFKMFLENEPTLRDILHNFYNFQYAECLKRMAVIKNQLLLDIYLADHVEYLYREIRNRALCQYFSPYQCADLTKIATCFNTSVPELLQELKPLISSGQLKAKIDSHNNLLLVTSISQQNQVFQRAFHLFNSYEKRFKATFVHNACIRSELYQNVNTAQNYGDVQMDYQ